MKKKKFHIRRGNKVQVISGNHKGAKGEVLQILKNKFRAIVEGVNLIKKHQRKTQDNPNGAIIEREGSIHISNLRFIEEGEKKKKGKKDKSLS